MTVHNSCKKSAGFTIIETMIVLAVAGLILLIVFAALPALYRSSRNNQRRQDISAMLSAVSHWELNNSGGFPGDCGSLSTDLCNSSSPTATSNPFLTTRLTYYKPSTAKNVEIISQTACSSLPCSVTAGPNSVDEVRIYNYEKCDTSNQGSATQDGAGYNDAVALFDLETASGTAPECQSL